MEGPDDLDAAGVKWGRATLGPCSIVSPPGHFYSVGMLTAFHLPDSKSIDFGLLSWLSLSTLGRDNRSHSRSSLRLEDRLPLAETTLTANHRPGRDPVRRGGRIWMGVKAAEPQFTT